MPRRYESSAAVCPFYRMEEPKGVYCEGFGPKWTIHLSKDGKGGSAGGYKKRFCYSKWQDCPISKMLQEKFK